MIHTANYYTATKLLSGDLSAVRARLLRWTMDADTLVLSLLEGTYEGHGAGTDRDEHHQALSAIWCASRPLKALNCPDVVRHCAIIDQALVRSADAPI